MIDEKELAIKGLAMRVGLVPCNSLPKPNPQKDVEDFLRRVALCVRQAAEAGHKECKFRVNGIPNTPLHVMEAAITPLQEFGYVAEIKTCRDWMTVGLPRTTMETYLAVSGWGD